MESSFWNQVKNALHGKWDAQRHEDKAQLGVPDVSFGANGVEGWIELKVIHDWPVRPTTPVKINHFTTHQKNWLWKRGPRGCGRCYMFLKVKNTKEYFLFHYSNVRKIGTLTQEQMRLLSSASWKGRINADELLRAISC